MRPSWHFVTSAFVCGALRAFALDVQSHNERVSQTAASRTEYCALNPGDVIDLSPGPVCFGEGPVLLQPTGKGWEYRATAPGHSQVWIGTGVREHVLLVFVTPIASRQVGRWDLNWYRTQFDAGPSECGPALVLIRSGGIQQVAGDPREDVFGRYYGYQDGHYVRVEGYSLDLSYFIVYDPYPADWDDNGLRYDDGVTMIGENRFYPAGQVLAALKTSTVLEVPRD
jgi:hypothetical protein